ncbi:MAG: cardiolipin synthase [Clostridia bacterium]|nr:cardiolipin synthase [Clostridia bacterium]
MTNTDLLMIIYLINVFISLFLIFFERKQATSVLMWSIILLLLPVLGLILYIFLGRGPSLGRRKKFLHKYNQDIKYQRLVKKQKDYVDECRLSDFSQELITFSLDNDCLCSTDNDVELFTDTSNYYSDLLREIEGAKDFINVEFFIIRDDDSGREFINLLAKKAFEGLKVRLLYDDIGCMGLRKNFFDCIIKSGGEVCAFLPSRFKIFNRNLNYRNHRKIAVIDGVCAFMGSSNIGDEYLGKNSYLSPWKDCNLKIKGTAAMHLNLRVMQDYNFATEQDNQIKLADHNIKNNLCVQILSDGPDSKEGLIQQAYIKAIYGARKRIYLQTPYFIPDDAFMIALITASRSGIDVRVVIPQKADKKAVHYATLSYVNELVKHGVKVYEKRGFLHSKTLLIDDEISSVGSFNIDIRSFVLQFEITTFIYDKKFNQKLFQAIREDIKDSVELTRKSIALRPINQKAAERFMRLLTPII